MTKSELILEYAKDGGWFYVADLTDLLDSPCNSVRSLCHYLARKNALIKSHADTKDRWGSVIPRYRVNPDYAETLEKPKPRYADPQLLNEILNIRLPEGVARACELSDKPERIVPLRKMEFRGIGSTFSMMDN